MFANPLDASRAADVQRFANLFALDAGLSVYTLKISGRSRGIYSWEKDIGCAEAASGLPPEMKIPPPDFAFLFRLFGRILHCGETLFF
jgi:hypothetical protein